MLRDFHMLTRGRPTLSARTNPPLSRTGRVLWTTGNMLMLAGAYLLLYIGGMYAQAEHNVLAARGDSDLPAPAAVAAAPAAASVPFAFIVPAVESFVAPVLNNAAQDNGQVVSSVPATNSSDHPNTITRVVIPSIGVDYKVVPVGWDVQEENGTQVAIWQVAEYAVGHHKGSANPGEGDNVVLAGHVGGYGKVFKDLYHVNPGDEITLYSNGQQYLYVVQERFLVQEEGVPYEQRVDNAKYLNPTGFETVTMITCWPATGPERFTQRAIVRAIPYGANQAGQSGAQLQSPGAWTAR